MVKGRWKHGHWWDILMLSCSLAALRHELWLIYLLLVTVAVIAYRLLLRVRLILQIRLIIGIHTRGRYSKVIESIVLEVG